MLLSCWLSVRPAHRSLIPRPRRYVIPRRPVSPRRLVSSWLLLVCASHRSPPWCPSLLSSARVCAMACDRLSQLLCCGRLSVTSPRVLAAPCWYFLRWGTCRPLFAPSVCCFPSLSSVRPPWKPPLPLLSAPSLWTCCLCATLNRFNTIKPKLKSLYCRQRLLNQKIMSLLLSPPPLTPGPGRAM